ncbi:MAG TPA: hypothetical protein VN446_00310 [Candidatus Acidoferrum sp.]|nr:hypothetical protein [Candidatus Acidoferrum sp.]
MKKFLRSALIAVMIAAAAYIAVSAAGGADDPLITLSYLNSVLLPALKEDQQKQVQELHDAAIAQLREEIAAGGVTAPAGGSSSYLALEMHEGETIVGFGGAIEVLLRRGVFQAVDPIGDKLANLTKGAEAGDGNELTLQNLYLVPRADGRGVRCVSGSGWVMVRGGYQVIDAAGFLVSSSADTQS